jgi:hypothetical protein
MVAEHPSLRDLKLEERRVSLAEFHSAAEVSSRQHLHMFTPMLPRLTLLLTIHHYE